MTLENKKVLLCATGGIAAYKVPLILRQLTERGAQVQVVLTKAAQRFVAPAALEVLAGRPVYSDLFAVSPQFKVLHVGLAEWADLVVVAPATANSLAKMALGLADDLFSSLLLGVPAPVLVAPAMEEHMWFNGAVQRNVELLRQRGYSFVGPERGALASGGDGLGRLAQPDKIVAALEALATTRDDLAGLRLLVTAGPTFEDLDPVRFIGNRSTGKMGFALAQRALVRGALVWLVMGPTPLEPPPGAQLRKVRSTLDLQAAAEELFDEVDAAVLAGAPADYRPAQTSEQKIKRGKGGLNIELVENPDVAAGLGRRKKDQILVGFAMETEKGIERAKEKLQRKNCDFIVLNSLKQPGAGFAVDTNIVTLIHRSGEVEALEEMSKLAVADQILDRILALRPRSSS